MPNPLNVPNFVEKPVYKIELENDALKASGGKKNKGVMPSAIAINPITKELFVTDGPKSNLLLLDEAVINIAVFIIYIFCS